MSDNQDIKNILKGIFRGSGRLSKGYNQYEITRVWNQVMGDVIAGYTSSYRFSKGTLEVWITSSALKQELEMSKENIMIKLNAQLPNKKVKKIIIR